MTEKVRKWFTSILSILFGSVISTACAPVIAYAAAYMGPPEVYIKGKVKDIDTAQTIADIRLSLIINSNTNSVSSGTNGAYEFISPYRNFTIAAVDIDGSTNGLYLPTNITLSLPDSPYYYTTNIDILMKTNG